MINSVVDFKNILKQLDKTVNVSKSGRKQTQFFNKISKSIQSLQMPN